MMTNEKTFNKRLKAVRDYLSGDESLRRKAEELGIHYNTLYRWVKQYKEGGAENLKNKKRYFKPWNRFSLDVEKKVADIKEAKPDITLHQTKVALEKENLGISIKGIWNIWKRYGYAGFKKNKLSNNFCDFIHLLPGSESKIGEAEKYIDREMEKDAAEIVNSLPICSNGKLLVKIADGLLTPKRKLEKLSYLFGDISYSQYRKKANHLRKKFLKEGYFYSAVRAGIKEILAMEWLGKPIEQLKLIEDLKHLLNGKQSCLTSPLYFTLYASEFIANIRLMKIERAMKCLRQCKKFSRTLSSPSFLNDLATLYSYLGYYREMGVQLEKVLRLDNQKEEESVLSSQAFVKSAAGEYRSGLSILNKIDSNERSISLFTKAHCHIGMGNIEKARESAQIGLQKAKKMGVIGYVSSASIILAEVNSALRDKKRADLMLKKYINILKKVGMYEAVISREIILNKQNIPEEAEKIRTIKLALLLRKAANTCMVSHYRKAYRFADRYKLLGVFHRLVLLIPEPVLMMLKKGKETGIPRAILNLPVFKTDIPVYYVKFLGPLIVYKNQRYLRTKLSPKDTSFLIHLSLSRTRNIPLQKIYRNFWKRSKHPARNLSHLLVRIRKGLRLPSHYLSVKKKILHYDCYFSTDYDEYKESVTQAKALLRARKWGIAKNEFMKAFSLFRDEPFKKMYDNWSDDKRLDVLFSYENDIHSFAKELRIRNRKEEAEKLMKKLRKLFA